MELNKFDLRKAKVQRELAHFEYLKKKGLTSLEIADRLNHEMFETMKIGLKMKYPNDSEEFILQKMREIAELNIKIKSCRKRRDHD